MLDEQIASARQAGFSDQDIITYLSQNKPELAPKINQAMEAKFTASDILNHLSPPKAGIAGNLIGGVASAGADLLKTGEKLGLVDKSTTQAADKIAHAAYGGQSYGERFNKGEDQISTGFGTALVENAPRIGMDVGASLGGRAIGTALGGMLGTVALPGYGTVAGATLGGRLGAGAGYALSNWLQNYGRRIQDREDKNGGEPATLGDKAMATGTSIVQAPLGALQVSKLVPGIKLGEQTLKQGLGRALDATATGVLTGAAGDLIEQGGRNIGTKDGTYDPNQTVNSALLGGFTGAGIRGAGETAGLAKQGLNKLSLRGYDHPDEIPNVSARLAQIAEENGLKLGKLKDDAQALKIANDEIQNERGRTRKDAMSAIDIAEQNGLEPKRATSARLAVEQPKPTKDQVAALQEAVQKATEIKGDWAEAQTAVDLAKKSSTMRELMKRAKFDESGNEPTVKAGGVSGMIDKGVSKIYDAITSPFGFTSALGGAAYAGYAGLPKATALAASALNAAPSLGVLGAGVGGAYAVDHALGLRSKVNRFVEGGYPQGGAVEPMGGGMQSMRDRVMAAKEEAAQAQAASKAMKGWMREAGKRVRSEPEYPGQQFVADNPNAPAEAAVKDFFAGAKGRVRPDEATPDQRFRAEPMPSRAQQMQSWMRGGEGGAPERSGMVAESVPPQAPAGPTRPPQQTVIDTGKGRAADEKKMAKLARDIASAQGKLDKLRGVERPDGYYEGLTQTRMGVNEMEQIKSQLQNDFTSERAGKPNAKNTTEEPTARKATGAPEETTPAKRKASTDAATERENPTNAPAVDAPATSGKPKGPSAKELPKGRNKGGKTEAGKGSAPNTTMRLAVQRAAKAAGKDGKAVSKSLQPLLQGNVSLTKARQIVSQAKKANPKHADKIGKRLDSVIENQVRSKASKTVEFTTKADPKAELYGKAEYEGGANSNASKISKAFSEVSKGASKELRAALKEVQPEFEQKGWGEARRAFIDKLKESHPKEAEQIDQKLSPLLKNPNNHADGATKYATEEKYLNAKGRKKKEG